MYLRLAERGMEFGWLFILIFAVLVIFGIVHIVNLLADRREKHKESPIYILKRRYAKGEISKEEFELMKDEITQDICNR